MEYSYAFNQMGRIDNDPVDNTQKNLSNNRYSNYLLSNYLGNPNDKHVKFATQQPAMVPNGLAFGNGLNGDVIDSDSMLLIKTQEERPYEKLQLLQRPFSTVPYLGRGYSNPVLESQLQQGEMIRGKQSVSTIMEQSFLNYSLYPTDDTMKDHVNNTAYTVEESALNGWVRGGADTRITTDDLYWSREPTVPLRPLPHR
jgi:hypothetical protein